MNLTDTKTAIERQKQQLRALGLTRIGIFGSSARGELGVKSDVDVILDFEQTKKRIETLSRQHFFLNHSWGAPLTRSPRKDSRRTSNPILIGTSRMSKSPIDWKSFAGLRDKLIHHYFGVDYAIVWNVATNELPTLKEKIEKILSLEAPAS